MQGCFFFLKLGSNSDDILGGLISILGKVVVEEVGQLGDGGTEVLLGSLPGGGGVQDLGGNASDSLGNLQAEDGVGLVLGVLELSVVDSINDGT